jgi:branched-chain amino acid transport system ATP-binding protein
MGLAPQLVEEIFEIVRKLNEEQGVSFLLAEQNTNIALRYAKYGYILESGRIVLDGEAGALRENEDVKEFYLGVGGEGRKSFRDVKHYKRRKRWLAGHLSCGAGPCRHCPSQRFSLSADIKLCGGTFDHGRPRL